jgi:hypothetical protein
VSRPQRPREQPRGDPAPQLVCRRERQYHETTGLSRPAETLEACPLEAQLRSSLNTRDPRGFRVRGSGNQPLASDARGFLWEPTDGYCARQCPRRTWRSCDAPRNRARDRAIPATRSRNGQSMGSLALHPRGSPGIRGGWRVSRVVRASGVFPLGAGTSAPREGSRSDRLPCRRSWVRIPSAASRRTPAQAGFSLGRTAPLLAQKTLLSHPLDTTGATRPAADHATTATSSFSS